MKLNKIKWLTWLVGLTLLLVSTGCVPPFFEDILAQLLPQGNNPFQRVAVEVTMTSEQLVTNYHDHATCEGFHQSIYKHLRYFSSGTFSSQIWIDNPLKSVFGEMMGHLADGEELVLFRKYYIPRTTIIAGRSDFDAKCYHDGGMYPELDEFYCQGGGGLDFEGRQQCVYFHDDQANDRIVVSGRPCEGSYFFSGCDKDCKEPGDWTTPDTRVVRFDADELMVIPAAEFFAGTTLTETIEIPGTCDSYHTINLTIKTESLNP